MKQNCSILNITTVNVCQYIQVKCVNLQCFVFFHRLSGASFIKKYKDTACHRHLLDVQFIILHIKLQCIRHSEQFYTYNVAAFFTQRSKYNSVAEVLLSRCTNLKQVRITHHKIWPVTWTMDVEIIWIINIMIKFPNHHPSQNNSDTNVITSNTETFELKDEFTYIT